VAYPDQTRPVPKRRQRLEHTEDDRGRNLVPRLCDGRDREEPLVAHRDVKELADSLGRAAGEVDSQQSGRREDAKDVAQREGEDRVIRMYVLFLCFLFQCYSVAEYQSCPSGSGPTFRLFKRLGAPDDLFSDLFSVHIRGDPRQQKDTGPNEYLSDTL
jgi:hypothetical protein